MIHAHVVVERNIKNAVAKRNYNSIELHLGEILGAFLIFIKYHRKGADKN